MIAAIDAKRAAALLEAARGRPVLVVGDVMLDQFLWGEVSRISPEAPVPVVEVVRESFHLGGAANVAHNLRSLGARPLLVGVCGRDEAARRLRQILGRARVAPRGLVADANRPTTLKTRIVAQHQQVVRADRESRAPVGRDLEDRLLARIDEALDEAALLLVSDYSKGTLTPRVLRKAIAAARRRRRPVLVDPKLAHAAAYRGASLLTPNLREAEAMAAIPIDGPAALGRAARRILERLGARAVLVTRGEQGMSLFEKGRPPVHIPAVAREVFDVTGAGDTVIATIAAVVAAGGTFAEAAALANHAAGVVVGKLGTAVVAPEELLASLGSPPAAPFSAGSGGSP